MIARTQEEILARFESADDFFGWAREVLIEAMTADTVLRYNPDATIGGDDWVAWTAEQIEAEARRYLRFAIEKMVDHRGISAERSTVKLAELAWLMGRDDVIAAMDAVEYLQYGAPKVKTFADGMGWPFISYVEEYERPLLVRMAKGLPCVEDCESGCGQ